MVPWANPIKKPLVRSVQAAWMPCLRHCDLRAFCEGLANAYALQAHVNRLLEYRRSFAQIDSKRKKESPQKQKHSLYDGTVAHHR